ncbi:MAG: sugar phosphate isomerase/epimerase [Chitinophagia bacterium]|nr:sugar phosphate isomerase/epimerase [Chitinophagia bacterium]
MELCLKIDMMNRRNFLEAGLLSGIALHNIPTIDFSKTAPLLQNSENRFKLSLNAYSFNTPLKNGSTTLFDILEFCARESLGAADLTGYYFPGYPDIPSNEYIYQLKRRAHQLGIAISGTGIRTEFGNSDASVRSKEVEWTKKWIGVAAQLGAPVIRVFTAKAMPDQFEREEVTNWIASDMAACAAEGKSKGVIVAFQNHNDFIKTAEQANSLLKKVNSEWFGLVLDTGSFVTEEPYGEIEKMANQAVNWQIKEKLNYLGVTVDMDLLKLFRIIKNSTYRGYLPIETLSPGNPFEIVPPFIRKVRNALNSVMQETD